MTWSNNTNNKTLRGVKKLSLMTAAAAALTMAANVSAHADDDDTVGFFKDFDFAGYIENRTFLRDDSGLSKMENTLNIETGKDFGAHGIFSKLSMNATFRARYEGLYDLSGDYGDDAGGAIFMEHFGGPGTTPWGASDIGSLVSPFLGFNLANNPNEGLKHLSEDLHGQDGGISLGVPVRPCNVDNRGCIDGYMDDTERSLRFPDFNRRVDAVRELYFDAAIPMGNLSELGFRLGRQQIIWGRTDLFRVLDIINPIDYTRQNIYDELEDIRIPMWMLQTEYRAGAVGPFDDLNFSIVWNFDKFRPHDLGTAGTPYQILGASDLFRALKNCWDNGCSVANFTSPTVAFPPYSSIDFGPGTIGIRQANLPEWTFGNTQWGAKVEGVFKGVGWSLNYYDFFSQLPSLRGGIPALGPTTGTTQFWPYAFAWDIEFPRVKMFGGSMDIYADSIKSVFRIETAYTTGEEFSNTLAPRLFSEKDVIRYVVGWDRDIFIRPINRYKAFLLSTQVFGQHILDHELDAGPGYIRGMPDWENNWIITALFKGWWMQNRLSPQLLGAYDIGAQALVLSPSVDWLINDNLRLIFGANFKIGDDVHRFDNNTSAGIYPGLNGPGVASLGVVNSVEPLGRFRSGPIGMASNEDELQLTLRYRF